MNPNPIKQRKFRKLSLLTLISVYVLILVGGIVRSTGAGMGCPDWPKCFGSWVPPTSAEQLPEGYKEDYVEERLAKNQKFAGYLEFLGFNKLAQNIKSDESIRDTQPFNAQKTWIEYVNRLVGVAVGLLILFTFLYSLNFLKSDPIIPIIGFISLVAVGFQGWIGSIVVSTNLLSWMITVHMLIALVIVGLITFLYLKGKQGKQGKRIGALDKFFRQDINILLIIVLSVSVLQIVFGTHVREAVDEVAASFNYKNRDAWIQQLGFWFEFHRSFAWVVIGAHLILIYRIIKKIGNQWQMASLGSILLFLVFCEILGGGLLAYFGIPGFIQPIHLVLATIMFGFQLLMIMRLNMRGIVQS